MSVTNNDIGLVEDKLVSRLEANIAALSTAIPSEQFMRPNGTGPAVANAPWIRANSPLNFGGFDRDASGSYEISRGQFTVQVFFPRGSGSKSALAVGKSIQTLYNAEKFDDLVIESVTVSPSPEPDSSPWYGVNVTVQFSYEGVTA